MAPELSREDIESLAGRTRGMRRDDIMRVVSEFKRTGQLPDFPAHPTNTCDPYTGNWAERLMDPLYLRSILDDAGFQASVMPGYWDPARRPIWKAVAKNFTNLFISAVGPWGLRFAPYYIICGKQVRRSLPRQTGSAKT